VRLAPADWHSCATAVHADGKREILGLEVTSAEDGARWLAFFRGLATRRLTGAVLITSDAQAGLVVAIAATLPGASWQRCRTHYLLRSNRHANVRSSDE
jgi:putative transposase